MINNNYNNFFGGWRYTPKNGRNTSHHALDAVYRPFFSGYTSIHRKIISHSLNNTVVCIDGET